MAKSGADIIKIVRNVTGRVDSSDPLFTDCYHSGRFAIISWKPPLSIPAPGGIIDGLGGLYLNCFGLTGSI